MARRRRRKASVEKYDKNMRAGASGADNLVWHSPRKTPFKLAGFPWYQQDRVFRRMPVKPRHKLPEAVDFLANNPAGGQIRFVSNSRKLSIRARLAAPAGMVHMPATGQCGFDCYVGPVNSLGGQKYLSTTKYDVKLSEYTCAMFEFPDAAERNITLNFPLYQGVEEVELGLEPAASVAPPPPYAFDGPIVIYGTSITQGGCATRPGMAYTNILSRRLNAEVVNLGFSGSGRGEPEVAQTIVAIPNPRCFVLDYEANTGPDGTRSTLHEFIRILRAAHAETPVLVVSRIPFARDNFHSDSHRARLANRDFQRATVSELRRRDSRIFFQDGGELLGVDFDECTVDGSHCTDLGFLRMANMLEPVLRTMLCL